MKPAVSGLAQEYGGRVSGQNLDATTEENTRVIKELGFESHGIVIRSSSGKILWKQPDHEVKMDDVRRELDRLLRDSKQT